MYVVNDNGTQRGPIEIIQFPTKEIGQKWQFSVNLIKSTIASVNEKLTAEGRAGHGTVDDYSQWLKIVSQHISTFGKDKVPGNIQFSLNSVEEGLGLPVTSWPERNNDN